MGCYLVISILSYLLKGRMYMIIQLEETTFLQYLE